MLRFMWRLRTRACISLLSIATALALCSCVSVPRSQRAGACCGKSQDQPPTWTKDARYTKVVTPAGRKQREITYYENSIGMQLVRVPAGEFVMGSSPDAPIACLWFPHEQPPFEAERPAHTVRITRQFYMGAHEVTRGQFRQFWLESEQEVHENSKAAWGAPDGVYRRYENLGELLKQSQPRSVGFPQTDEHPIVCVTWHDAQEFCRWLSEKEGRRYRLPREAEWEYAARAGTRTVWYWGDSPRGARGCANVGESYEHQECIPTFRDVEDGWSFTAPVGSFAPNGFGLYDVIGNVAEWCADWYDAGYYGDSKTDNPEGPPHGRRRVFRGGAWLNYPWNCRSSYRNATVSKLSANYLGFRVVCEPIPSTEKQWAKRYGVARW